MFKPMKGLMAGMALHRHSPSCVEAALSILQELRGHELGPPVVVHQSIPLPSAFSPPSVSLLPGDTSN